MWTHFCSHKNIQFAAHLSHLCPFSPAPLFQTTSLPLFIILPTHSPTSTFADPPPQRFSHSSPHSHFHPSFTGFSSSLWCGDAGICRALRWGGQEKVGGASDSKRDRMWKKKGKQKRERLWWDTDDKIFPFTVTLAFHLTPPAPSQMIKRRVNRNKSRIWTDPKPLLV